MEWPTICYSQLLNAIIERRIMGIERWLANVGRLFGLINESAMAYGRSDPRNQCLIVTEFGYFGQVDSVFIRNLNRSGAFVETQHPFSIGEAVRLKFPLHYLDPPVEISGVIAWTGADGVGVKFNTKE